MTKRARRLLAGGICLVLGPAACGCGTVATSPIAHSQVVELDWHENCGTRANPLPIRTNRLIVGRGRWRVWVSFRNQTHTTLGVIRPHVLGGTYFGLEPFKTGSFREVIERVESGIGAKPRVLADRFVPSRPNLLAPGDRWSGSFSGRGALPAGVPVRVVLGRFVISGPVPPGFSDGFLCISTRVVRLK